MHTKHVTLLNIFIPWFDYISFDMLFGERHLTYSSICVSDSLSLHFARSLFLVQKHTDTHPTSCQSCLHLPSLSKRSLFKGSVSGRIGPWSLPKDYQWRQSTLMLLLYAEISTNRIEGKVETKRETRRETVKFRKTDRQWGKVWWALNKL